MASKIKTDASAARERLVVALAKVARGDEAALKSVYQMTSAKLFGICLRISADRQGAEDILQDVYLKVWSRAGRFDPERASPITWLCAIARNAAIDWRRSSSRPAFVTEDAAAVVPDAGPLADELIEQAQDGDRLTFCMDQLETTHRSAIRAAFFDGLTYAELAERMSVPLGTMKSWVRRSLLKLKTCISHA